MTYLYNLALGLQMAYSIVFMYRVGCITRGGFLSGIFVAFHFKETAVIILLFCGWHAYMNSLSLSLSFCLFISLSLSLSLIFSLSCLSKPSRLAQYIKLILPIHISLEIFYSILFYFTVFYIFHTPSGNFTTPSSIIYLFVKKWMRNV